MELKDILKAAKEKELPADVIAGIEALDQSAEVLRLDKELTAEQGKSTGILEDKKKYKDRAEKSESELKKIEDGKLTADELGAKKLEEAEARILTAEQGLETQKKETAAKERANKILTLTSSIKWAEGVPKDTAALIIKNATAGIDDLSDKTKLDAALKAVTESHKALISAEAPAGSGDKGGGGGGSNDKTTFTLADSVKEAWTGKQ